jgi:7-cyano-7-deazaguanine synthase
MILNRAVCLVSGGLDSAVAAAIARSKGYEIYAITFDYMQRHRKEIECAKKLAKEMKFRGHKVMKIHLEEIGGSALTDKNMVVPTGKDLNEIKKSPDIPVTYVPARNTVMLSFALAYAEVLNADYIYLGANHVDYSGYPDCRPEYFKKFQEMADLATKRAVGGKRIIIETPLLEMNKAEITKLGAKLKVPFQYTWSCYKGGEKACGKCDSCVLRLNGFKENDLLDPILYEI